MPKYRITAPDGNTYEITAPDGASEEEVLAYAQQNYQAAKPDFSNVTAKVTPGRGASIATPKRGPVPRTRAELDRVTGTSTQAPSVMEAIGGSVRDFADSAQQGFMRPIHGAAELLQTGTTNALEYAADVAPSTITSGLARLSRDTLESDRQALQQWEAEYQARRGGANSTAGELVGGALPFAVGAPARAGTALMARIAPTGSGLVRQGIAAGTVGGIGGAVAGLAEPVQSYDNYVEQKAGNTALGGAAGAVISPIAGYVPAAIRGIAARFSGPRGSERRMGARLLEQAGGPVQVQESQVPGVRRTLDEATDNQGIMAYGRNLRRLYPQEFADQDMANNAARYRTLEGIAGDEDAMEAALESRRAASAPLYREAGEAIVPVTDDLKSILSRVPNSVMNSAKRLAKIEGRPWQEPPTGPSNGSANVQQQIRESLERAVRDDPYSSYGLRVIPDDSKSVAGDTLPPSYRWDDGINTGEALPGTSTLGVRRDLSDVEKMLAQLDRAGYQGRRVGIVRGEPVGAGDDAYEQLLKDAQLVSLLDRAPQKQSQAGIMSGQQLHYIKLAIDNALSGQGGGSLGNVERALLMQVKDDLVGGVSSAIPAYADAMGAYSGASGPISRMEIGRRLLEKTDSSRVDPSGVPILSPFQYAKNTRNLDRVAQDATGFNKAKAANILSPEDIRNISAIGDDMQRIMRRQSNPTQPGSATMEATELAKRIARQGVGSSLGRGLPVVERLAEYFAKRRESKDLQTLFELYRNPQRAQQVMSQLGKKDRAKLSATLSMLAVGMQSSATNNQEGQ